MLAFGFFSLYGKVTTHSSGCYLPRKIDVLLPFRLSIIVMLAETTCHLMAIMMLVQKQHGVIPLAASPCDSAHDPDEVGRDLRVASFQDATALRIFLGISLVKGRFLSKTETLLMPFSERWVIQVMNRISKA